MGRRLSLIFAQSTTVTLAVVFVVSLLMPDLLSFERGVVTLTETPEANRSQMTRTNLQIAAAGPSYSDAAKKATPAVVNIFTSKEIKTPSHQSLNDSSSRRNFADQLENVPSKQRNLGSGVIVSSQGYILTNHHVVEGADEIQVALADGRIGEARVIGTDPDSDLAVLKTTLTNLRAVTFGHSEEISVGDVVLAIGDPFGVGQTVTMTIVSALGRSRLGINQFENFIQTDAPINPGNSGGCIS